MHTYTIKNETVYVHSLKYLCKCNRIIHHIEINMANANETEKETVTIGYAVRLCHFIGAYVFICIFWRKLVGSVYFSGEPQKYFQLFFRCEIA